MKKMLFVSIVTTILFLSFSISTSAAPFLVCDPQAGVISYNLELNGGTAINNIVAEPDGSIKYDLAGIAVGSYIVRAQACNEWDCSGWSVDFPFTKAIPSTPANIRIEP